MDDFDCLPAPRPVLERLKGSGGNLRSIAYYSQILLGWSVRVQHKHIANAVSPVLTQLSTKQPQYDLIVVGGGIVGLATAREIALRNTHMNIALLEKENQIAMHQTGHNSGVIHMGIYYKPGSLKAQLCVKGQAMIYRYLDEKKIPYKKCGKVIVAVDESEVARLRNLYVRAVSNNVPNIKMINAEELKQIEPHCQGRMAIHSPNTGIVDWSQVAQSYAEDFKEAGGTIFTGSKVNGFELEGDALQVKVEDKPTLSSRYVITCCGLHSDRVAQLSGCSTEPRIVPFRGEYLLLDKSKTHLINGNIYPVPDPRFPFLGVHFTPRMDGSVWIGPNAVLAFSREGYGYSDFSWKDFKEIMTFKGLRKLVGQYWRFGCGEMYRSLVMRAQLKQLQRFVPEVQRSDIRRGPTGVRAQAMDIEGNLVGDFVFDQGEGELGSKMLHVRNAPSPGATSSLAIAEMIADRAQDTFKWTT